MRKIKLIPLLLLSIFMVTSCVDDEPQLLERNFATTPYVIGFPETQRSANYLLNQGPQTLEVPVNLINGFNFTNTPLISATYFVSPLSTAVEGQDFEITDAEQKVTINPNRDFGTISLNVLTDNLSLGETKTLILVLAEPNLALVADQFKQIAIELVGFCESDLAGAYTSNELITGTAPNTTIEEISPGLYRIAAMPYIAFGGAGGDPAWIEFTDVCGVLEWGDWEGDTLTEGSGIVNEQGVITFTSLLIYNNNIADPNDIWFDLEGSTYTPN